jgi:hypothetical protein
VRILAANHLQQEVRIDWRRSGKHSETSSIFYYQKYQKLSPYSIPRAFLFPDIACSTIVVYIISSSLRLT